MVDQPPELGSKTAQTSNVWVGDINALGSSMVTRPRSSEGSLEGRYGSTKIMSTRSLESVPVSDPSLEQSSRMKMGLPFEWPRAKLANNFLEEDSEPIATIPAKQDEEECYSEDEDSLFSEFGNDEALLIEQLELQFNDNVNSQRDEDDGLIGVSQLFSQLQRMKTSKEIKLWSRLVIIY